MPFVLLYFDCIKTADPYPEKIGLLSPKTLNSIAIPHFTVMITVFVKERNKLSQSFYDSDMKDIFIVEPDGSLTPIRILNKQENATVKREKVRLT